MSRLSRQIPLVVLLAACAPEVGPATPSADAGRDAANAAADAGSGILVLDLVRPDRAGTAGGTAFEIFGRGFTTGARVTFLLMGEEVDATDVTVGDSTRMTGRTPNTSGRTGRASVRVSLPTGRTATLPDVFSFADEADGGVGVDMGIPPLVDMGTPPVDMGTPPVDMGTPAVDMGTLPVDMGTPPVDMGTAPVDMGTADALAVDSGPRDLGPPDTGTTDLGPTDMGTPDTGPRDTGPTDTGPIDSGTPDSGSPRVTVCLVEGALDTNPASGSYVHGYLRPLDLAPRATRIQLTIPGLSGAPGMSPGVVVELGRGPIPALGSDDLSSWAWTTASYITDAGSIETYQAAILAPIDPGEYGIAARVTVPGATPIHCDLDGIGNGFSASMTGVFTVLATGTPDPDYCHLQYPLDPPPALTGRPLGTLSEYVYGWVYEPSCTDTGSPTGCSSVTGEVGYGARGSYPSSARWVWTQTSFNAHPVGGPNNDEHRDSPMRIVAPGVGTYDVAYRFRIGSGAWRYCDRVDHLGSTNDYHPLGALLMTITP